LFFSPFGYQSSAIKICHPLIIEEAIKEGCGVIEKAIEEIEKENH